MEIKIKCPSCGKILRLADNPNINNAVFTCPVCKEKHKVGNCQRITNAPVQNIASEETQYSFQSMSAGGVDETMIAGSTTKVLTPGRLVDNFGRSYTLNLGVSTIGRKAVTSIALRQIDTDDRTMSRNHAIIEVKASGGQLIHIIRNSANKNPSYLNGKIIEANDQLILNDGDRLKFGSTELIFKK